MFNGVGDCLLSNPIKMRGHGVSPTVTNPSQRNLQFIWQSFAEISAAPSTPPSDCLTQVRLEALRAIFLVFTMASRMCAAIMPACSASAYALDKRSRCNTSPFLDPCEALAQIVMPSWPMRSCSRSLTARIPASAASVRCCPCPTLAPSANKRWAAF